jgi:hypothetical protein
MQLGLGMGTDRLGKVGSSASSLVLDGLSSAPAVAYSVRKLRTAYAGNCLQVRRSSDNATQNIGFVGNALDTASLLTFVGANNGFVSIWYDQSGNANDASQPTAGNQPRIVSSGSLQTINSLPTVFFITGSTSILAMASATITGNAQSGVVVAQRTAATTTRQIVSGFNSGSLTLRYNTTHTVTLLRQGQAGLLTTVATAPLGLNTLSYMITAASELVGINGSTESAAVAPALTEATNTVGCTDGAENTDGGISEAILWQASISTGDRQACEASAKAYFGTP